MQRNSLGDAETMKAPTPQEGPGHLQGMAGSRMRDNHINGLKDKRVRQMIHCMKVLPQKHED